MADDRRIAAGWDGQSTRDNLIRPLRISLALAGTYCVIGSAYIAVSGQIASRLSSSLLDLQHIELIKGTAFVVVTSFMLFGFAHWILGRLLQKEIEMRRQQAMILATEKRAAAGLFAASTAHDINNILTVSATTIEDLSASTQIAAADRVLVERLARTEDRLRELSQRLSLASGRHLTSGFEPIDAAEVVRQAIELCRSHPKVAGCRIETVIPPTLRMQGDASLIHRMILNLVINAGEATDGGGRIRVAATGDRKQVVVEVHDDGPGMSAERKEQALQPFFTTKEAGSGLGLLSMRMCARIHQGSVEILDSDLGGACFRVTLSRTLQG